MAHKHTAEHTVGVAKPKDLVSFVPSDLNIKDEKPLRDVPVLSAEIQALFAGIESSDAFDEASVHKKFSGIRRKK